MTLSLQAETTTALIHHDNIGTARSRAGL